MAAASFRSQKSHPHGFVRRGIIIEPPVERPAHHGELPKLGFEIAEIPPRQPALRAHLDHRHHKPRLRAQRSPRRQDDDRAARSADPTSSRPATTAGASRAEPTITPQPALAPSPQPRPPPTGRALIVQNVERRRPSWMPIWVPIPHGLTIFCSFSILYLGSKPLAAVDACPSKSKPTTVAGLIPDRPSCRRPRCGWPIRSSAVRLPRRPDTCRFP